MGHTMSRHWLGVISLAFAVTATFDEIEHNKPEYEVGEMGFLSCSLEDKYMSWKDEDNLMADCQFVGPDGEIYKIGTSGSTGYGENSRVDCLCGVDDSYHPLKTCGIYVKDLGREDNGLWSCKYLYKNNWITKEIKVQVGPDPYKIIGGFDPVKGDYLIKWGKTETLTPGNLFHIIPALGSEYKLKFNLLITSVTPGRKNTVLMFTADNGLPDDLDEYVKYGERIPAIYYENGNLIISSWGPNIRYKNTISFREVDGSRNMSALHTK